MGAAGGMAAGASYLTRRRAAEQALSPEARRQEDTERGEGKAALTCIVWGVILLWPATLGVVGLVCCRNNPWNAQRSAPQYA